MLQELDGCVELVIDIDLLLINRDLITPPVIIAAMPAKPDYGIDAPGVIRNLVLIGIALLAFGYVREVRLGPAVLKFGPAAFWTGGVLLIEAALMLVYSRWGKFRHRDRMLKHVSWRGDEQVLDVGTGRGLLLIAAAKHLTTGKAVGIDVWKKSDLSDNRLERTQQNIAIEGVAEKTELRSEDAQKMSFPDASFDLVVSNLCLHNIPTAAGREQACHEIARVLKPGGVAVISDFIHTRKYAAIFGKCGLRVERGWRSFSDTFPPLSIITARK